MKLFTIFRKKIFSSRFVLFSFKLICLLVKQVKFLVHITDRDTGEPVIGANIIIENTFFGAAADIEGYYYINNIPPGKYTSKLVLLDTIVPLLKM
jgi:hypothetical protein